MRRPCHARTTLAAGALAVALAAGCTTAQPQDAESPPAGAAEGSIDPAAGEFTRELNEHLLSLIEQSELRPLGGDHDWMNASQVVEVASGAMVSVFMYPVARANRGDVTFEQFSTRQLDGIDVRLGRRSDGLTAARFNCGTYQFQFAGDEGAAVQEAALKLASVATCPYTPDVRAERR